MIAICPTSEDLKSLSLGKLSEEHSDQLVSHLESCETCQSEISDLDISDDTFVSSLRSASNIVLTTNDRFDQEGACRVAASRALAALATVESNEDHALKHVPRTIGEYEIVRPLGRGGMGNVYLGRHTKLRRLVAIKFIAEHRRWDQSMRDRFETEMQTIGQLKHPNIVAAFDAREVDGIAALITEYIDGLDVSEIVRRNGQLSVADASEVVMEVCHALDYCDDQGLVHRDIKPSNIMLSRTGEVTVLDLGLARIQASDNSEFTATGQALGTADYVSPEQINDGKNVDHRTDLYSLGCTFFKLLTGRAPFAQSDYATGFAKMNAHVSVAPPRVESIRDDVPIELCDLIDHLLKKSPNDRPRSVSFIAEIIDPFTENADLESLVTRSLSTTESEIETLNDFRLEETLGSPTPKQPAKRPLSKIKSSFFSRSGWLPWIATGLACLFLGLLLGIIITVKRPDGTTTQIEIPDGSTAIVDAQGNIEITLAGSGKKVQVPGTAVTNLQTSPSVSDPESADKKHDASLTTAQRIAVIRSRIRMMERKIFIPLEDPSYGTLKTADNVDIFAEPIAIEPDQWVTPRLVQTRVRVVGVKDQKDGEIVGIVGAGNSDFEVARIDPALKFTIKPHDPKNFERMVHQKMEGVWRTMVIKSHGQTVRPENSPVAVVFRGQGLILNYGSTSLDHKIISIGAETMQAEFNTHNQDLRKTVTSLYRFLPSGRLELAMNDSGAKPDSFNTADTVMRLGKTEAGKEGSALEKEAMKMFTDANDTASKIEFNVLDKGTKKPLGKPVITSADIISAKAFQDKNSKRWNVDFELTYEASQRLYLATKAHIGAPLQIRVNEKEIMAPTIQSTISQRGSITGGFSEEEANKLAREIVPGLKPRFQSAPGA